MDNQGRRERMVAHQIVARGVRDERVLDAMRTVPREIFVPGQLAQFAYDDSPLPIEEGQTISQPFVVALMVEALEIGPHDRVLEIGAGSGYAAAVMSRVSERVFAVERHEVLARLAQQRADHLGYANIEVIHGDGTLGWADNAPYDAILVSAGAPDVPDTLRQQLMIGGRLVVPVGDNPRTQELLRIQRTGEHEWSQVTLGKVQFVPLVGAQGWSTEIPRMPPPPQREPLRVEAAHRDEVIDLIRTHAEPYPDVEHADLDGLLERIGDARVVLIGEASHGTSEFYEMRARITRELIEKKGFDAVTIEGDWPDTAALDRHVRGLASKPIRRAPFADFPTWMWRNQETGEFVEWLAEHNHGLEPDQKVSMHGLDLYSLNNSIGAVLDYLEGVDPDAAEAARLRFGCFSPWESDPAVYGRAVTSGEASPCEQQVLDILQELLSERLTYMEHDGEAFFDAERNAAVIRDAEQYYRAMYASSRDSWNLRDTHMFDTLRSVLDHRGPNSKAVVWAHNSHIGDASATEMGVRGEFNIGQLARETYGRAAYSIGMGTHEGTVAAASNWNDPVEIMSVRPSHPDSCERLCHDTEIGAFLLPLGGKDRIELFEALVEPRLERAIGVIYRPTTELLSHYFQAALPVQFDEYVWFNHTTAVLPLDQRAGEGTDMYPFAL